MICVYRYDVPPFNETNAFEISLHAGASIIEVAELRRKIGDLLRYDVYLWAVVDTSKPVERRRFWMVRDGESMDPLGEDAGLYHVASWRSVSGEMWSHMFEITQIPEFTPSRPMVRYRHEKDPLRRS